MIFATVVFINVVVVVLVICIGIGSAISFCKEHGQIWLPLICITQKYDMKSIRIGVLLSLL